MNQLRITKSITKRDEINSYLKDVARIPLLTPEKEKEIAILAKKGDKKAQDKLITSNLRFAISVAKQYQGRGLDLADLINEANIGLWQAVQRFDPNKGFKFISYAVWWVRQSITKALYNNSRTIRLPLSQYNVLIKINKTIKEFEQKNERLPSTEELSIKLDEPADKIARLLEYNSKTVSFDTPFSDDEESGTLIDIIPNRDIPKTDKKLIDESENKNAEAILNLLSWREHDIVKMYFGIACDKLTLDEIGRKFGITGERARQVKEKALKKLQTIKLDKVKEILWDAKKI